MTYANNMSPKPKLYTDDMKHPKDGSNLLTEERIKNRETEAPVLKLQRCVLDRYKSN